RVDDNDKLAGVQMRRVLRTMLAAQDGGNLHRQPADDLVGGVDDEPTLLDLVLLGHVGRHRFPCLSRKALAEKVHLKMPAAVVKASARKSGWAGKRGPE